MDFGGKMSRYYFGTTPNNIIDLGALLKGGIIHFYVIGFACLSLSRDIRERLIES